MHTRRMFAPGLRWLPVPHLHRDWEKPRARTSQPELQQPLFPRGSEWPRFRRTQTLLLLVAAAYRRCHIKCGGLRPGHASGLIGPSGPGQRSPGPAHPPPGWNAGRLD